MQEMQKPFRKDMTIYEESDEYCPHCDNHYVIEAKEPKPMLKIEGEDARVDARFDFTFISNSAFDAPLMSTVQHAQRRESQAKP
ncbi:hypothetical protein BS47DRAFT_1382539, partial [Hydnum rufescens UP504]